MANFTPQEIEEMLQQFFDVVGKRQYIGARYVPQFGRRGESSIDWDNSAPYEPLTIVIYQGNSYTSRTYVPTGIDITNESYWALTGAYNAQVEAYRQEVIQLQEDWIEWKQDTLDDLDDWKDDTIDDFTAAIDNIPTILPSSAFSAQKTVKDTIDYFGTSFRHGFMVVLGDSWSDEQNDPNNTWLAIVAHHLQLDGYITNAKAGNGFAHGTTNSIPNQVAGALTKVEAAGYTAADVTLVVAVGGVNDYRLGYTYLQTADGIRSTWANIRNTFPNAKPLIIYGTTGRWNTMDTLDPDAPNRRASYAEYPNWLALIQNNLNNYNTSCCAYGSDVALWLNKYGSSADANIWNTDTLHPVQIGASIFAHHVIELVMGIHQEIVWYDSGNISNTALGSVPLKFRYRMSGKHIHIDFYIDTSEPIEVSSSMTFTFNTERPRICGGTSGLYRIPVIASNFNASNQAPMRGYYNAATNVLTLYPQSCGNVVTQVFGSVDYDLY